MSEYDHWMPLHIGDYLADTRDLTTLQHGIYLLLIMHYWKRRELPTDERALARIAGLSYQSFRRVSGPVMALFQTNLTTQNGVRESRFSHSRLDTEISKAKNLSERRKVLGKNGALVRWGKQKPSSENSKSYATRARDHSYTQDQSLPLQGRETDLGGDATERVVRLEGARAQPRHPTTTPEEIQESIRRFAEQDRIT